MTGDFSGLFDKTDAHYETNLMYITVTSQCDPYVAIAINQ